jgi:hypothetical protein
MSTEPHRITWTNGDGQVWRAELISDRWQLARWRAGAPARGAVPDETDEWQRVGSYPTRQAAIDASHTPDLDALLRERDQLIRQLTDRPHDDEGGNQR